MTTRAALGIGFNHIHAGGKDDEPVQLDALLGWALLASRGVRILADMAGYWGTYRVSYYATGHGGVAISDPGHDSPYQPCADSNISIEIDFDTIEARESMFKPAADLFWRMMWAFGQVDRMWSPDTIEKRLLNVRRWAAGF